MTPTNMANDYIDYTQGRRKANWRPLSVNIQNFGAVRCPLVTGALESDAEINRFRRP